MNGSWPVRSKAAARSAAPDRRYRQSVSSTSNRTASARTSVATFPSIKTGSTGQPFRSMNRSSRSNPSASSARGSPYPMRNLSGTPNASPGASTTDSSSTRL